MTPYRRAGGFALLDALVAMLLLGFVATGAAALMSDAVRLEQSAARLDRARDAGRAVIADLERVSWARLPQSFEASGTDSEARLDTQDSTAPPGWDALAQALPEGRIEATLLGLGPDGARSSFESAVCLRVRVGISWREATNSRRMEIDAWRF